MSDFKVGLGLLSVYPESSAGTTTYIRGLLAELPREDISVVVVANDQLGRACADLATSGVEIRGSRRFTTTEQRYGRVPALAANAAVQMVGAESFGDIDVVHYPQSVRSPRVNRPAVVTLHDVQHLDLPELFSPAVRVWRRLMYDESARHARVVITDSEHARSRIVEHLGIDPGRIHVSYLGVDHDRFAPGPNDADTALLAGFPLRRPYVYYPASLEPHKNHAVLLDAMQRLPDHNLVLTGPASGRVEDFWTAARSARVAQRVQHLGLVDADAIPALYRGAASMVFPSLYEGFGAPIIEAMACGCPVSCSIDGAPSEIAGGAAVPFDPRSADAVAAAILQLEDENERSKYVEAGLRRAARFRWEDTARSHARAYAAAVTSDPRD